MAMPSSNSVAARHAPSAPATHATVDSRMSEIAIALRENPSACSVPTSRTREANAAYIALIPPRIPPLETSKAVTMTNSLIGAKKSQSPNARHTKMKSIGAKLYPVLVQLNQS